MMTNGQFFGDGTINALKDLLTTQTADESDSDDDFKVHL